MNRTLTASHQSWPLREPFVISRGTVTAANVVVAQIEDGSHRGRGEAGGVKFHGESPASVLEQIENVRTEIEGGATRQDLLRLLPAGGARNALDIALWDLEAKLTGIPVWRSAGVEPARPVITSVTIGIRSVEAYERRARELVRYPWLKIKVGAEGVLEAIQAVRRGSPRARLVVDANQAWSVSILQALAPQLAELSVDLLEQPIDANHDEELLDLHLPVPVCADEAAGTVSDLPRLVDRYDFINIKLDKAGGLTSALELAHAARAAGLRLMVGCMTGSSLSMAPAMVVAQLCEVCDLDGPLLQADDVPHAIHYEHGTMSLPTPALWG